LTPGEPGDLWNLTHPDEVEALVRSYVEAGSQVVLTNTFRANPVALAALGAAGKTAEVNRLGVVIAQKAAGTAARVFGSIGPVGPRLGHGEISPTSVTQALAAQAEALAEAGVDALVFETFSDVEEARLALRAGRSTHLPLVMSFSFGVGPRGDLTLSGASPEDVAAVAVEEGASTVGLNCGSGGRGILEVCRRLARSSRLPVWVKPNAGPAGPGPENPAGALTDESLALLLPALVQAGAAYVGGWCGTGPDLVRRLVLAADQLESGRQSGAPS
jgi:methionine synthase I (cobalamin-dependent)